ncbi:MAG: hypothetical protein M1119_00265 [Firmicutes bacterium]|nr:hypothetical protein [Bacillota bacterium]
MAYVLDEGMRIFFLDQQTVKQLGFSMEKIYRIALRNFFRDLVKPLQVFDTRKTGIVPQATGPDHGANRDVVMLFSPADQAVLRQAFMIGHSSFINNPYPISGSVYELHNGIIKEYQGLINHN